MNIVFVYLYKDPQIVFLIISVYVDDLNIIGIPKDTEEVSSFLKLEFEIK